jgi:hypothetical protein
MKFLAFTFSVNVASPVASIVNLGSYKFVVGFRVQNVHALPPLLLISLTNFNADISCPLYIFAIL